jgi:hypothetical protein
MMRHPLRPAEGCHADGTCHTGMRTRLSKDSQDHIRGARSIEDDQITTEFRHYETD